MNGYKDATPNEIEAIVQSSWKAFTAYRKLNLKDRANFLRAIAKRLKNNSEPIIKIANEETNLEPPRLQVELTLTIFQLESYAQACEDGAWLDIRINTANTKTPSGSNDTLTSHSQM